MLFSWAVEHHEELKLIHSDLEFKLHKLKFLSLLRAGYYKEALYYSRRLSAFEGHMKGIITDTLRIIFSQKNLYHLFNLKEKLTRASSRKLELFSQ